jgi:hypothetical protein
MQRIGLRILGIVGGIVIGAAIFMGMLWWVAQPYGLAPIARGVRMVNWSASLSAWALWGFTSLLQIALWVMLFSGLARLAPRREVRD